jgi:hypothetical protein
VFVDVSITGPEAESLTTDASDADGNADAARGTSAPNKRGMGGTMPDQYTMNLTGMAADGILWDGIPLSTAFNIN